MDEHDIVSTGKALTTEVRLLEVFLLDHSPHRAIDDKDALLQGLLQEAWVCFVTCHEMPYGLGGGDTPPPKKLAIFDAFEILNRIDEEQRLLDNKPKQEVVVEEFGGFAEKFSKNV